MKGNSQYSRVTGSNISSPNNLVCDNCVNDNMYQNKLNEMK